MFIIMDTIVFPLVAELHTLKVTGEIHQRVTRETRDIGTRAFALSDGNEPTQSLRFVFDD